MDIGKRSDKTEQEIVDSGDVRRYITEMRKYQNKIRKQYRNNQSSGGHSTSMSVQGYATGSDFYPHGALNIGGHGVNHDRLNLIHSVTNRDSPQQLRSIKKDAETQMPRMNNQNLDTLLWSEEPFMGLQNQKIRNNMANTNTSGFRKHFNSIAFNIEIPTHSSRQRNITRQTGNTFQSLNLDDKPLMVTFDQMKFRQSIDSGFKRSEKGEK